MGMVVPPPVASQAETIAAILRESKRPGRVPIRKSFVQMGVGTNAAPGQLAEFTRRGRSSALDQFLLTLAWASGGEHDVRRDSRILARAVVGRDDEAARRTISRNWRFLKDLKLVSTNRAGRLTKVVLLQEDGSHKPYKYPSTTGAQYFQLPFAYWADGWHEQLGLPGKAVLLISLSLLDFFRLPADRGPAWYGMSASTIERGLRELRRNDLLEARFAAKPAPLAPAGYTIENYYRLLPPFGPKGQLAKGVPDNIKQFLNLSESTDTESATPSG
jgi:DNA-binding transcriptional ArsR family regulator